MRTSPLSDKAPKPVPAAFIATPRIGSAPAGRMPIGRPREVRQKAEREVPLAGAPELTSGEPRPEAALPGRRHPLLDVGDHLLGRRAADAREQRRCQVRVLDRAGRLGVLQPRPGGVRQHQRERLLSLVVRVVEHPDAIVFDDSPVSNRSVPLAAV